MKLTLQVLLLTLCTVLAGCGTTQGMADRPPKRSVTFPPQYPFELFQAGVTGSARVEFVVAADGTVTQARVIEASHPDFGRSALACIRKWKFESATKDGRPVAAKMQVSFSFENPRTKNG